MAKTCDTCDWNVIGFCLCGKSKTFEVKPGGYCREWQHKF